MPLPTSFGTENRTYRQLLGNGLTYRIPPFQRDYSWGPQEWEDLWLDLLGTLAEGGEPAHYMGYLVLQSSDNRTFGVIDGQQRLTTISLIVLAAMRLLERLAKEGRDPDENRKRLEQIRATYIGYLDPVTLSTRNKLALNRNNDDYYRDYLVPLVDPLPQRGFSASTHAMRKSFEWFEKKLRERIKGEETPGRALAQFVESMSDRLFFTVITVADELNAYKVFETLNARGVRLSATDLLKNWLFSVLAKGGEASGNLAELERLWENLVGRLGSESFPDFLRVHWNGRVGFARQSELFKTIRAKIGAPAEVFALLRAMDADIDTYLALTQPEGSAWPPEWRERARELRTFNVRQPYPMLLSAKRNLGDEDFGALMRATVIISFRYNVIGAQPPSEQERLYHQVALDLEHGRCASLSEALERLRPIYPSDAAFASDFCEKSIKTTQSRNAKVVRYILARLEKQASGRELDRDSAELTIEHVLPESPGEGWEAFSDRDLENYVYRLGNMALLGASANRSIENLPYAQKREALRASGFSLTARLAEENDEWTPERIDQRQRALSNLAKTVWRLSQLS